MVNMTAVIASHEANQRVIQAYDTELQKAVEDVGKVNASWFWLTPESERTPGRYVQCNPCGKPIGHEVKPSWLDRYRQ
jgi:hypothetical protein